MDVKAYISSGVLELYIIGQLTPREMVEVEQVAAKYPEVKNEIIAIEQSLEAYSLKNQVQPAPDTFQKIQEEIKPATSPDGGSSASSGRWLSMVLAAASVLLAIGLFVLWQNNNQLQTEKAALENELADCEQEAQNLQQQSDRPMAILRQQGTRTVLLEGTDAVPNAQAAVYFNPVTKKAYLDPFQLDPPSSDKQYQLWALIGGQPTDMGVFDQPIDGNTIIEVPFIAEAEAFAITLEPAGGSVNPTLEAMQVLGTI